MLYKQPLDLPHYISFLRESITLSQSILVGWFYSLLKRNLFTILFFFTYFIS